MESHRPLSSRLDSISPFHVMDILARAKTLESEGRHIVHMEVGEPDFPTPEPVRKAAADKLAEGHIHYTPALGLTSLRERISRYYKDRFSLEISLDCVGLSTGASGALQLLLAALLEPGDRVLMSDPGYPCNRHIVTLFGGSASLIAVGAESRFQLTAEILAKNWRSGTKAVMLASPANPTGAIIPYQSMQEIYQLVSTQGAVLIVDEIYQGLTYGIEDYCAAEISPDIVVINSFSKYFGMTGWRLGWFLAPEWLLAAAEKIAQNLFLAPPTLAQYAALSAFHTETIEILEARKNEFAQRLDLMATELPSLGFELAGKPDGAFYLYADCHRLCGNSLQFCQQLLEHEGVAITPGIDFGSYQADAFVRFACTTEQSQLRLGLKRIKQFLASGAHAV